MTRSLIWLQVLLALTVSLSSDYVTGDKNAQTTNATHVREARVIDNNSKYAHGIQPESDAHNYVVMGTLLKSNTYDKYNTVDYINEFESNDEAKFEEKLKYILKNIPDPKVSEVLKIEFDNQENNLHDPFLRKGRRKLKTKDYKVVQDLIKNGLLEQLVKNRNDKMKFQFTTKRKKTSNKKLSFWNPVYKIIKYGKDGVMVVIKSIPKLFQSAKKVFKPSSNVPKPPSQGPKPPSKGPKQPSHKPPKQNSKPKPSTKPRPKQTPKRTKTRPKTTRKRNDEDSEPDISIPSVDDVEGSNSKEEENNSISE